MIVTFKTPAYADIVMFGDVAKHMMEIMGKQPTEKGIITVEQLPEAIARLKAAIAEDKAGRAGVAEEDLPEYEASPEGRRPFVALAVRAVPLLEQLEYSLKEKKPVVWGV
jgi:hypothetical protein